MVCYLVSSALDLEFVMYWGMLLIALEADLVVKIVKLVNWKVSLWFLSVR